MKQHFGLYSPGEVIVELEDFTVDGFDDDMIETERLDPEDFKIRVGPQGDSTFIENLNRAGVFKLYIKQNAKRTQRHFRDLAEAKAQFSTRITRKGTYREEASGATCVFQVTPRKTFKNEETPRLWQILTNNLVETDKD